MGKFIKNLAILATIATMTSSAMAYTIERQWYEIWFQVEGRCNDGTYFNGSQGSDGSWTVQGKQQGFHVSSLDTAIRQACLE
ncbi:hypothetical protein [Moraxella equi]|uniref:Uncharacterized protein n=1 Tax=Moraxella equi TaxID=60442 RepID=A0A378QTU6_9GAMM|nr:hypothetical protein [Moraxella equi]OPH39957.1 hypothetical protein B5J93_01475 [Moraxella equi]STZ04208.1 Uncharacterised protein [Moraxella equi]